MLTSTSANCDATGDIAQAVPPIFSPRLVVRDNSNCIADKCPLSRFLPKVASALPATFLSGTPEQLVVTQPWPSHQLAPSNNQRYDQLVLISAANRAHPTPRTR